MMARIREPLWRGNSWFAPALLGGQRGPLLRNLVLFLFLLGMFFLGFHQVVAYEDGVTRSTFTVRGTIPVPVLEMRPTGGETSLVAIVAHGFSGSKELMASFGVELAQAGVTTYLFDFPGHGESPVSLTGGDFSEQDAQDNITTVGEVVAYARAHKSSATHPDIVLLGHSMGSGAVGDYSMVHAVDSDIIATVLISPVGLEQPTSTQPKNLLILAGQNDIPSIIANGFRLQQQGCGFAVSHLFGTPIPPQPVECGDPAQKTGRRIVVLAGLNHITILTARTTFQELLAWLSRISPRRVDTGHMQFDRRLFWRYCQLGGMVEPYMLK